jgi:hypothetical protein
LAAPGLAVPVDAPCAIAPALSAVQDARTIRNRFIVFLLETNGIARRKAARDQNAHVAAKFPFISRLRLSYNFYLNILWQLDSILNAETRRCVRSDSSSVRKPFPATAKSPAEAGLFTIAWRSIPAV